MRAYEIAILLGIPSSAVLLSVWADHIVRRHQQHLDQLQRRPDPMSDLAQRLKDGVI